MYFIKEGDNGDWSVGTIINDASVPIISFTEGNNVREKKYRRGGGGGQVESTFVQVADPVPVVEWESMA